MPTNYLHKQDTDVILLQEVPPTEIALIRGYNWYTNVGINKRVNAMLIRQTIKVPNHAVANRASNCIALPKCRIVNMCTQSGSSSGQERKNF